MSRTFTYGPGPHSFTNFIQLAIQAHDLALTECELLRRIVTNNYMPSKDYQLSQASGAFLQGYEPPLRAADTDGWVLVEFWTGDEASVKAFVDYVNTEFAKL